MLVMTMGLVIVASQPFATIHSSAFHGQEWTIAVGGGRVRHASREEGILKFGRELYQDSETVP
jgi:hypothetical protein